MPQGAGDAGVVLNKAILTKGKPEGDVLWGVDNTLLSRAVDSGAFEPYESPATGHACRPRSRDLVPGHELTPVDYGDVCINYDKAWFAAKGLAPPQTLDDLRQPAYKDLLVVENPATSSPGLVFLLATDRPVRRRRLAELLEGPARQRREGGRRLDAGLLHRVLRLVGQGRLPARRLVRVEPAGRGGRPPTRSRPRRRRRADRRRASARIEFAGVLKGTKHPKEAGQLIDFLLGKAFQEDMPLNMYVYPVLPDAALPDVFTKYAVVPTTSLSLPPQDIAANRDQWIDEWTNVVLR